jgi:hypothetical protein
MFVNRWPTISQTRSAGASMTGYADHRAALDELIAGAAPLAAPARII